MLIRWPNPLLSIIFFSVSFKNLYLCHCCLRISQYKLFYSVILKKINIEFHDVEKFVLCVMDYLPNSEYWTSYIDLKGIFWNG